MFDYHIHPNYSLDAEGTIEEYCERARGVGLEEIAFTTHLDTDGVEDCFVIVRGKRVDVQSGHWFEDYEQSIRRANDHYQERGLRVLVGVEVDCYEGVTESLPEDFFSTDFDIILGSVHLIDHIAISDGKRALKIMKKYSLEELGREYFTTILNCIELEFFDILAHLDLYRRFGELFYNQEIHSLWKPYISDIIRKMKKHDVGFEVNTSSWRRGMSEPMPSTHIIDVLRKGGIKNVTVGSDAHNPNDVGSGIARAMDLLSNVGFSGVSRYERRNHTGRKI